MNIRNRTFPDRVRHLGVDATLGGLAAVGTLHALWAAGSSWPRSTPDELADLVVGARPFPSSGATWAVTGLIAAGAALVAAADGRLPSAGVPRRWLAVGAAGVAAVLATRGVGGLAVELAGWGAATEEFRHWDLRVYSPLCLALAVGAAIAADEAWPAAR